jgi:hypothetical protein
MSNFKNYLTRLSEKQKRDIAIFEHLKKVAKKLKLRQLSEQALKKIYERLGLIPPNVKRTKDLSKKVSFVIEINRLVVYLHTTFNREKCEFTPGALSVVVEDPFLKTNKKNKRVFFRQFNKSPGVHLRVDALISFFIKEFREERRPLNLEKDWATIIEKGQDNYVWADGRKKIRGLFDNAFPNTLVYKIQNERRYYEKTRKRRGVKERRREIKKPYKQKRY